MVRKNRPARVKRPKRPPVARSWMAAHQSAVWYIATGSLAAILYAIAAPVEASVYEVPVLAALFITAARCAALVFVVRWPVIGVVVFAISSAVVRFTVAPPGVPWPWTVTAIVEFTALVFTAWSLHGWRSGLIAYLVPGLGISAIAQLDFNGGSMAGPIVALSVGAVAAGIGALVRDRVRVGHALEEERQLGQVEQERRLVAEERQRIARELHDVVAHGLSLIQIQATSAPYRVSGVPPEAAAEFADIARSARGSLAEMRQLLGALRGDGEPAERAPQPTVADIPALVAETRRAGAEITLAMPEGTDAPPAPGIAAYRIVQEAISNAVRHAPGARIDAVVDVIGGVLAIDVMNGPSDAPPVQSRPGHGLVGMRERAAILGGSLDAARTNDGGFRVLARLPLGAEGEDAR